MNDENPKRQFIVGLGELLWDMLPAGRQLGGAPANFALMSARLGNHAAVLSRIGRDEQGRDAVATLKPFPIDLGHLQVDSQHPTGTVSVELKEGQASYRFAEAIAWDFLDFTPEWQQLAARADAVCFGTLAQRKWDFTADYPVLSRGNECQVCAYLRRKSAPALLLLGNNRRVSRTRHNLQDE